MVCFVAVYGLLAVTAAIFLHGWLFQKAARWGKIEVDLLRATGVAFVGALAEMLMSVVFDLAWFGVPPDFAAMQASLWANLFGAVFSFLVFAAVVAFLLKLDVFDAAVLGVRFFLLQWCVAFGLFGGTLIVLLYSGLLFRGMATAVVDHATQEPIGGQGGFRGR